MPKKVTAGDGDTLCKIAVDNGFRNCKKLRDANPTLATRDLRPGDVVEVPDIQLKDEPGQTEQTHKFVRKGVPHRRIFYVQDFNKAKPEGALSDQQRELAITNYVPGRAGARFASVAWSRAFGHNADASADPDHFKMQILDVNAGKRGDATTTVTIKTQLPTLNASNQITAWQDVTGAGTSLVNLVCQQVGGANSPWYRSKYLRLLVDRDDQNNRVADVLDNAADLTDQTLVAPPPADNRLEVLDQRVHAEREVEDCGATGTQPKCKAIARANVGKNELAMRIKVVRINGAAGQASTTSPAEIQTMIKNMRGQIAQMNVGLNLLGVVDAPPPRNMIAVGDDTVVKASGGKTVGATVSLATGNVTATIQTSRKDKPAETANKLAAALRAKGVTCRVSPNRKPIGKGVDFGPCDILCFRPDNTLAEIVTVQNDPGEQQKLSHTGNWDNNNCSTSTPQYGTDEPAFRLIGSRDFRAMLKNNFENNTIFHAYVINGFFNEPRLLGLALIPYTGVDRDIQPIPEFTMGVVVNHSGATRFTTLTHESGHAMLDAIHTSNNNKDHFGNTDNRGLGFSEIMTQFDSSQSGGAPQPFLHKRMADSPLVVKFEVAVGQLVQGFEVIGDGGTPSVSERYRTKFSRVFGSLRRLVPAPGSNL